MHWITRILVVRFSLLIAVTATQGRPANLHRRSGTDIGARRHGGKVARIKKKGARTCRPGTAGADIGRDRHRRCQYVAADLPHGRIKAAGGIKPQDYQWCTPFTRKSVV